MRGECHRADEARGQLVTRRILTAFGVGVLVAVTSAAPLGDLEHLTLSIPIGTAAERASDVDRLTGYESDVRRIARVFDAMGLPLPTRVTLHLYPSTERLAAGLVHDLGVSPRLAKTIGRFAAGVAHDDTLLVLEPEFQRGPRAWIRLLAHEMAHLAQVQLAGGRSCGAQWIAEGMADHVADTVLTRLGVRPGVVSPDAGDPRAVDAWSGSIGLDRLTDPEHFLEHSASLGAGPLYRLAFVLVQRLIEREGLDAVVEYFRVCPTAPDANAVFERVFGQRPGDFARDVLDRTRTRAAPA
jgi:hypothetical protein